MDNGIKIGTNDAKRMFIGDKNKFVTDAFIGDKRVYSIYDNPLNADFHYRETADGTFKTKEPFYNKAKIQKIAGRTVSYNQLFREEVGQRSVAGIPFTVSNGRVTANGVASVVTTASLYPSSLARKLVVGHKYIVKFNGTFTNCNIRFYYGSYTPNLSGDVIVTATAASDVNFAITTFNTTDTVTIDATLSFTDLTQAGLADIITTPEQFEEWQQEQFGNKGYLDYTPGKLVSVNPTGIKTTAPGGDEHTLPLDFTEHFPNGLNGVNDVVDEVYSDEFGKFNEGDVRFGKVDMGTLNWRYNSQFDCFTANISAVAAAAKAKFKAICPIYRYVGSYLARADKSLFYIYDTDVAVKDDFYNGDYTTFKAAMSGFPLIFELATPQHVTFTDPSDAIYQVDKNGTEQLLPVNDSNPVTLGLNGQISYGK